MNLRRRTISKVFAVWFVVLIVLPFTAPFQTVDFALPDGQAPIKDLLSPHKPPKDATTLAPIAHVDPLFVDVIHQTKSPIDSVKRGQLRLTVLRL